MDEIGNILIEATVNIGNQVVTYERYCLCKNVASAVDMILSYLSQIHDGVKLIELKVTPADFEGQGFKITGEYE